MIIDTYGFTPNLDERHHTGKTMSAILRDEIGDAYGATVVAEVIRAHGTILRSSR